MTDIIILFPLQLFAVQLASYLCVQFPLPKALEVVKCVMSRLNILCETLPAHKCAKFFIPACHCFIRFCQAFPPLCMDTSSLLLTIGRMTASRASGNCGEEIGEWSWTFCSVMRIITLSILIILLIV